MALLVFGRYLIWSRTNPDGGTTSYYYYDEITWVVMAIALCWLTWYFLRRYQRWRALRRRPRRRDYRRLKRVVQLKQELSSHYLRRGFSGNIHAIGIGRVSSGGGYCIQVFVRDAQAEMWPGSGAAALAPSYQGVPLVLFEMPMASFLADTTSHAPAERHQYEKGIRRHQDVIVGGISGANSNLTGQSGTIGYFCTRRSKLTRRKEIHLLSNAHVFADLRKTQIDNGDLIMQPSPGEPASNRPIGALVDYSRLRFDAEIKEANQIDAAIAKLWEPHEHKPLIPFIGAVQGLVQKKDIEIGEAVRKFGRTTGYTEGRVFSIYLDIWIRYDRTGQSAFFQNQVLIEPAAPEFTKFVAKGDSGSLLVDSKHHAIGLIFGGMSELPESLRESKIDDAASGKYTSVKTATRIESYGLANPISEVLDRLKIDLLV